MGHNGGHVLGQQLAIGDYGLLGDTRAAALVTRQGSIDWLCLPRFDADPVFGQLIDAQFGGRFVLRSDGQVMSRRYRPHSTVLETSWAGEGGTALTTDCMALDVSGLRPQLVLVRGLECTQGEVTAQLTFDPRLGLPGREPRWARRQHGIVCEWGSLALCLQTFPTQSITPGLESTMPLRQGERLTVVMSMADRTPAVYVTEAEASAMIESTDRTWRDWAANIEYDGPFRHAVVRSLMTLRLLTYSPSGAPIAAPTTSIPELVGGVSNWDYRYAWPRDAAIGSGAFMATGLRQEAEAFLRWLEIASRLSHPKMDVLYTVDGTPGHQERLVTGVSGYRGSLPVRIANQAARQHQLDVYGWVIDTAWHLASFGARLDGPSWRMVRSLADFVAGCWRDPDAGIWELRNDDRQNVSSKFLAFVALDRAARMAHQRGSDRQRAGRWTRERDLLRDQVRELGWSAEMGSYVADYGHHRLDASLLLLPMSELEPQREREVATIRAIRDRLGAGGVLLYRFLGDDGKPHEGAFLPCTFWLIDALARTGAVDEAQSLMEVAIQLGGELGLYAEEMDPSSMEMLGNHPQALTHSSLVTAALSIEQARGAGSHPGSHHRRRAQQG